MIVVALKTVFLIGILSVYSAAIFHMINDYFRKGFNDYMKTSPLDAYKSNTIQHAVSMPSNQLDGITEISQISTEKPIQKHPDQQPNPVVGSQLNAIIKHLVFSSDNSRCLLMEYVVQIFLRDPVCVSTQ